MKPIPALLFFMTTALIGAGAESKESPFPLSISANGRHLVDASGKPFLLHGDTAWMLMVELTREEAEDYLENRRQKGFNTILVSLGETNLPGDPTRNSYGEAMFTTPEDLSTPSEKFFAHVDWVIQRAREKGILVVLNPCYVQSSSKRGLGDAVIANEPAKCRGYGRYIGERFKDHSNIIWQAMGDRTPAPGSALERNWLEILLGIKELAPSHHWTAHWGNFTTALDQPAFAPFMTLDNTYSGNRTYIQTLRAYNRPDPKPVFLNEAHYEGKGVPSYASAANESPSMMRAQAYWTLLSGATGHIFGSHEVWHFGWKGSTKYTSSKDWRSGLESLGSRAMVHVKKLFEGRAWHQLVPDQDHSVVTGGYGTFGTDNFSSGGDYVTAARTPDGKLAMAYVPATRAPTRTLTVNLEKLSGPAHARWHDPTSGKLSAIEGSPFANKSTKDFTTPGKNSSGANDWVLVIETASPSP